LLSGSSRTSPVLEYTRAVRLPLASVVTTTRWTRALFLKVRVCVFTPFTSVVTTSPSAAPVVVGDDDVLVASEVKLEFAALLLPALWLSPPAHPAAKIDKASAHRLAVKRFPTFISPYFNQSYS
jgi:hypothetical protein